MLAAVALFLSANDALVSSGHRSASHSALGPPAAELASKGRREVLRSFAAVSAFQLLPATAADVTVVRVSDVRVSEWPPIEYMEPMVELKQLLDGLVDGVKDEANWPFIRRRLDKFFSGGPGGIFSDRYFYQGVSAQYVFKIKYESTGPSVDADKLARQNGIISTMEALQQLRTELKDPLPAPAVVRGCAARAQDGLAQWLAQVPAADVERVGALIRAVRAADMDRNGELSPAELGTLQPADQLTWKARQDLFG